MSTYAGTGCGLTFSVGTVVVPSLFSLVTATVVLVLVSAFQIIQVKKLSKVYAAHAKNPKNDAAGRAPLSGK